MTHLIPGLFGTVLFALCLICGGAGLIVKAVFFSSFNWPIRVVKIAIGIALIQSNVEVIRNITSTAA